MEKSETTHSIVEKTAVWVLLSARPTAQSQALTELEAFSVGDLALEGVELSLALNVRLLRAEAVWIKTEAFSQPSTLGTLDRVAETLDWGQDLQ